MKKFMAWGCSTPSGILRASLCLWSWVRAGLAEGHSRSQMKWTWTKDKAVTPWHPMDPQWATLPTSREHSYLITHRSELPHLTLVVPSLDTGTAIKLLVISTLEAVSWRWLRTSHDMWAPWGPCLRGYSKALSLALSTGKTMLRSNTKRWKTLAFLWWVFGCKIGSANISLLKALVCSGTGSLTETTITTGTDCATCGYKTASNHSSTSIPTSQTFPALTLIWGKTSIK